MRITRYTAGKTNVQELQAARNAAISPAEAAAAQMVKFGAISDVSVAASGQFAEIAQRNSEEELASAVTQFESAMMSLDAAFESAPMETDENGNLVQRDVVTEEREARNKIAGDVRSTLKSGASKEGFDKYMQGRGLERDQAYLNAMVENNKEFLSVRATSEIDALIAKQDHEGALARTELAYQNGVYGAKEREAKKTEIRTQKSKDRITNVTTREDATSAELEVVDKALSDGKWADGTDVALSGDEIYAYQSRIRSRQNALDAEADTALEMEYEQVYLELLPEVSAGKVTVAELVPFRWALGEDRFDKLVGFARAERDSGVESDSAELVDFQNRVIDIRMGEGIDSELGYKDTVEELKDSIRSSLLSFDDKDKLITELDGYVKAVRSNPDAEDILDIELTKITGRSADQLMVSIEGVDKSHLVVAKRLEQKFKADMVKAGPDFDAGQWMKDNVTEYHIEVQTQILKNYGITQPPRKEDGSIDGARMIQEMYDYRLENSFSDDPDAEENIKRKVEESYNTWMRLIEAG